MLVLLLVVIAAATDFRWRRIPNALTFGGIVVGWSLWIAEGSLWQAGVIVIATLGVLLAGFILFSAGVLGGGDGKLLAGIVSLEGTRFFFESLLWTLICGAVISLLLLAIRRELFPFARRIGRALIDLSMGRIPAQPLIEGEGHKIAYALVIACGVILTLTTRYARLDLLP